MKNTLLSHLEEEQMIYNESTEYFCTVGEFIERGTEKFAKEGWYIANKETWKPSAKSMVEQYLENESCEMYEDFEENMYHSLKNVVPEIQKILDKALANDTACDVYRCDFERPIEIDI